MIRDWWNKYGALMGVLGIVLVCLVVLLPRGSKPTPARSLGVNAEFAFPGKETPAGSEVDSGALVENANAWNGRTVTLTGEAIGERMIRGDMAWIHVNDDAYAKKNVEEAGTLEGYNSGHAIWLPADLPDELSAIEVARPREMVAHAPARIASWLPFFSGFLTSDCDILTAS